MEITIGPAGKWGSCYGVIPLSCFTSEHRASKASIRRSCDIVFPEVVSFPLKQRLALHGALMDKSLPEPMISEGVSALFVLQCSQLACPRFGEIRLGLTTGPR